MPHDRRRFLQLGLGGAVLLAAGGGLASWVASGYEALLGPGDVPIALRPKELAIARALVEALFPEEDGFPGGVALGVHQRIDEEVWAAPDRTREDLENGLELLEHLPPLFGHPHRFTALAPQARVELLSTMAASRRETLRQVAAALKQLACVHYYSHPLVWERIGYDGPFVEKPLPPESRLAYEALLRARRAAA